MRQFDVGRLDGVVDVLEIFAGHEVDDGEKGLVALESVG